MAKENNFKEQELILRRKVIEALDTTNINVEIKSKTKIHIYGMNKELNIILKYKDGKSIVDKMITPYMNSENQFKLTGVMMHAFDNIE